jgi:hypothetical protein
MMRRERRVTGPRFHYSVARGAESRRVCHPWGGFPLPIGYGFPQLPLDGSGQRRGWSVCLIW